MIPVGGLHLLDEWLYVIALNEVMVTRKTTYDPSPPHSTGSLHLKVRLGTGWAR